MERRKFAKSFAALLALGIAPQAMSVVGRPATPASVGGVRRRTRRRTRRRVVVGMSIYSLPAGCPLVNGLYYCGGAYYQPVQQGTTVVYVCQDIDEGAEPYIEE